MSLADDQFLVRLNEIRKELERQGTEKGFDHKKTSLWQITGALKEWLSNREKEEKGEAGA